MGLAKEVSVQPQPVVQSQPVSDGIMPLTWNDVPIDIWRFYGIYPEEASAEQSKRLKEINDIVGDSLEENTIGNVMHYLNNLDLKLGATPIGESRVDRVWSYLKLGNNIKEMVKRQRAFER